MLFVLSLVLGMAFLLSGFVFLQTIDVVCVVFGSGHGTLAVLEGNQTQQVCVSARQRKVEGVYKFCLVFCFVWTLYSHG